MIYLDSAATTACLPEVVDAMLPFFRETFANASSIDHLPGVHARRAVDSAREHVAELVGAKPEDVIFTSGSTEANNLALSTSLPVFTTPIEHPSVLDPHRARRQANDGMLRIDADGLVDVSNLRTQLSSSSPALVAVIATNNETGIEQDLAAIQLAVCEANGLVHFDATQAVLTRRIIVRGQDIIDGISLSAHKIYGPKGVGALIAGPKLRKQIRPSAYGGGHERGFRSGTLNVPGIVGFGEAAKIATKNRDQRRRHIGQLRSAFINKLRELLEDAVYLNAPLARSSPHILSVRIGGVNARALLVAMHGEIAFSLGSACATNKSEPSHVLLALGRSKREIAETFRVSFSADQTECEVTDAAATIASAAMSLRSYSVST